MNDIVTRVNSVLSLLPEGHRLKIGGLTLQFITPNLVQVTGWSRSNALENITEQSALIELSEMTEIFREMVSASEGLNSFISGKQIEFVLAYDYGMGSVHICSEIDGKVNWERNVRS
jgi:hypothetical protein